MAGLATPDAAVSAVIAEFVAMRGEIDRRSNEQHAILGLAITATGTIAAFVLSKHYYTLLPLIPFLNAVLGMRWLDHHRRIREIGDYIKTNINQRLRALTGEANDLLANEAQVDKGFAYRNVFRLFVSVTFAAPAIAAGIVAAPRGHHEGWNTGNWTLLIVSLIAFVLPLPWWWTQFIGPTTKP